MPLPSSRRRVVGRHLRQARRRGAQVVSGARRRTSSPLDHVAGLDERVVARDAGVLGHRLVTESHEFVDVELVVREQHEILEVLRVGARVVAQAVQRVVDPRCREQRQGMRLARLRHERAVGDAVVHGAEIGQVEQVAQQQPALGAQVAFDVVVLGDRKVDRDRLDARADLERHAVVLEQEPELLEVVAGEQVWAGQRRLVGARAGHETVTQAGVGTGDGVGVDANERVAGAHPARRRVAADECPEGATEVTDAALVDLLDTCERRGRIVETGGRDEWRRDRHVADPALSRRSWPWSSLFMCSSVVRAPCKIAATTHHAARTMTTRPSPPATARNRLRARAVPAAASTA